MPNSSPLPQIFDDDINLKGLLDIINPKNNLVLADDMMLSDADGTILRVSETYEQNFGFAHDSIVGKSAFDLETAGVFTPCVTAEVIRQKKKITTTQTINAIHQNYRHLQDSLQQYSQEIAELRLRATATNLVVKSNAMQRLWTLIQNTANTKANILITGETGVGKSAVAKAIHAISNRANGPFIEVNCAVLHENLIESELFGYEKGAFTGAASGGKIGKIELANHGTLFLDEIGELPHHIQSKLLQLIQEKTIERLSSNRRIELDFRLIVATNRNLEEEVQRGLFRSDLFYRLNVIRVHIPPLRQRPEDILPLAYQFLERFCREYGKQLTLSPRFVSFLEQFSWPGNVRQLENLMERLVITSQDPILDTTALPPDYGAHAAEASPSIAGTLEERMNAYEGQIIRESYRRCRTTVAVAKDLGISQATAARKIAKYVGGRKE